MKTENLVALLASGVEPVDRYALPRRLVPAVLLAAVGALLLMVSVYGIRPDIHAMLGMPLFWAKCAFPLVLSIGAVRVTARLCRPGVRAGKAMAGVVAPVLAVWLAAALLLCNTPASQRLAMVLGHTWHSCPFNIALLSVPGTVAVLWAIRGLAPTRLRLAGAAGGLLAGAIATVAYCLHCPEMASSFWAVWYVLGMLIPAAAGALAGPRVLRW